MPNIKTKLILFLAIFFSGFLVCENVQVVYPVAGKRKLLFRNSLLVLTLFFAVFIFAKPAYGACEGASPTWTTTPDYESVASCVSSTTYGDTINVSVGDGTEDWNTVLIISKGIKLIGPGAENLIIKNTGSSGSDIIQINPSDYSTDQSIVVSGFTFDANGKYSMRLGAGKEGGFGLQTKVRIHHNTFTDSSGIGIKGGGITNKCSLFGVVDNNTFTNLYYPIAHSGAAGYPSEITKSWWYTGNTNQSTFTLGSDRYMYFEDNTFTYTGTSEATKYFIATDGEYSARFAFRYNTFVISNACTYQLFEIHGINAGHTMDACFGAELYGNKVTISTYVDIDPGKNDEHKNFFKQRNGQTRVFNNQVIDEATDAEAAYYFPYNNTPLETYDNCTTETGNFSDKVTHNSYWWGNWTIANSNPVLFYVEATGEKDDCDGITGFPRYGRDVFADDATYPGTESTDYDNVHVLCGTLDNLPETCVAGQGYWATNQSCSDLTGMVGANPSTPISGALYKCVSANTWSIDGDGITYTPFIYPHPLRNESPADTTAPAAPTNLAVN